MPYVRSENFIFETLMAYGLLRRTIAVGNWSGYWLRGRDPTAQVLCHKPVPLLPQLRRVYNLEV
jgi:hypothetical protein